MILNDVTARRFIVLYGLIINCSTCDVYVTVPVTMCILITSYLEPPPPPFSFQLSLNYNKVIAVIAIR